MDVARETLDRGEDHEIADDPEKTVIVTLELLESRLRAIEHALYGHMDPTAANGSKDKSAATRLRALELALEHYTAKTKVIQDLLKLCKLRYRSTIMALTNMLSRRPVSRSLSKCRSRRGSFTS